MSTKSLPSQEYLRQCFDYNPETGEIVWKQRPLEHFPSRRICNSWNARFPGTPAGAPWKGFNIRIKIARVSYEAGRLVWKLMTGDDPVQDIDHKNGNALDNRWSNLRPATHAQNMMNKGAYRRRSALPKGVYPQKRSKRNPYYAKIRVEKEGIHLGVFPTPEQAHAAYLEAAKRYFGEFARAG